MEPVVKCINPWRYVTDEFFTNIYLRFKGRKLHETFCRLQYVRVMRRKFENFITLIAVQYTEIDFSLASRLFYLSISHAD